MREPVMGSETGRVATVLHTAVATLYSNLVTRPTGRAVRLAIERQIEDTNGTCLSILDFSRVGVMDFSCADEVIAKLLVKYSRSDRPAEAYFVARGVSEHHRDPIEAVLERHGVLLVTAGGEGRDLLGPAPTRLRRAWSCLEALGRAVAGDFAAADGVSRPTASSWLRRLAAFRVAIREEGDRFSSLSVVLDGHGVPT